MDNKAISAEEAKQKSLKAQTGDHTKSMLENIYNKISDAADKGAWKTTYSASMLNDPQLRANIVDALTAQGYETRVRFISSSSFPDGARIACLQVRW